MFDLNFSSDESDEEESDSDGDGGAAGAASPPRGPVSRVFQSG